MELTQATVALAIALAIKTVSGQFFVDNETATYYSESVLAAVAHATRMQRAEEWSDPGSYAILVISEVGQTTISDAISILVPYLMQKRHDELDMYYVELESNLNETDVRQAICDQLQNARRNRLQPSSDHPGILINAIIDTTESLRLSQQVSNVVAPFGLPTFAITSTTVERPGNRNKLDTRINFSSLANYMAAMVRAIIAKEKLSTAALYYDSRFDPVRTARLSALGPGGLQLNNATTRHSVRELDATTPARAAAQLKRAEQDNIFNWFLFVTDMKMAETFLVQAERAARTKPGRYSWFVINTSYMGEEFECSKCEEARVNVFRPVPIDEEEARNVLKYFTNAAAKSLNETQGLAGVSGTSNEVRWRLGSKLNATMATNVLYYYDVLSAMVKMIKRLENVGEMITVDIVELACNPPPEPVKTDFYDNSTTEQNFTTPQPRMTRLSLNMSTIAEDTEHMGVLGLVSLAKLKWISENQPIEWPIMLASIDNYTVFVQANIRITQYNFKEEVELGVIGKAQYYGELPHDDNNNISVWWETPKIDRVIPWGTWTLFGGLILDPHAPTYFMSRKLYKVAFIELEPYMYLNITRRGNTGWHGYITNVMVEMSNSLGFDYIMDEPVSDGLIGSYNHATGKWNGVIRELVEKRADMALGPIAVTSEREDFVDFTLPIADLNGITILMKKNKDVPSMFKFVHVFAGRVWLCCGGVFIFVSITIWIFDYFSPYSQRNILRRRAGKKMQIGPRLVHWLRRRRRQYRQRLRHSHILANMLKHMNRKVGDAADLNKVEQSGGDTIGRGVADMDEEEREKAQEELERGSRVFSLKESFWFTVSSLTPQGSGDAPSNLSGRLMATVWWIFVFIIVASYTANLAAFLTVSRLDSPIEQLDDLMRQNGIRYAPHENSEAYEYFRRMALIEDKFYDVWSNLVLNDTLSERDALMYSTYEYPIPDKYTRLFMSFQANVKPKTFWEGVQWVKDSISDRDGFALIADEASIKYAVAHDENCDLKILGGEWSRTPYSIAVQDDSPLKEELNGAILELLNDRILETHYEGHWEEVNTKCYNMEEEDFLARVAGISIKNVGGVFVVVAGGTLFACSVLLLEIYWFHWRETATIDELTSTRKARYLGRVFGGLEEAIAEKRKELDEHAEERKIRDIYEKEFGLSSDHSN